MASSNNAHNVYYVKYIMELRDSGQRLILLSRTAGLRLTAVLLFVMHQGVR